MQTVQYLLLILQENVTVWLSHSACLSHYACLYLEAITSCMHACRWSAVHWACQHCHSVQGSGRLQAGMSQKMFRTHLSFCIYCKAFKLFDLYNNDISHSWLWRLSFLYCSYSVMRKCWNDDKESRPTFLDWRRSLMVSYLRKRGTITCHWWVRLQRPGKVHLSPLNAVTLVLPRRVRCHNFILPAESSAPVQNTEFTIIESACWQNS